MEDQNLRKIREFIGKTDKFVDDNAHYPDEELLICAAMVSVVRNIYLSHLGMEQTNIIFDQLANSFQILNEFENIRKPTLH